MAVTRDTINGASANTAFSLPAAKACIYVAKDSRSFYRRRLRCRRPRWRVGRDRERRTALDERAETDHRPPLISTKEITVKTKLILAGALLLAAVIPVDAATMQAFKPSGQTVLVSATTTTATVTLNGAGGSLLVYNACTVPVRIETNGSAAVTPTTVLLGSLGVPAATYAVFEIGTTVATVAVKLDSAGPCNIELTRGEGMAH
jgi:hypothetical protein